jgi:hypothetical protein
MTHDRFFIRQELKRRGISIWSAAKQVRVDPSHLRRVLSGKREGNPALLYSVAEIAGLCGPGRYGRTHEEIHRLIDAAAHVFFLKRGQFFFESAIFADLTCGPDHHRLGTLRGHGAKARARARARAARRKSSTQPDTTNP